MAISTRKIYAYWWRRFEDFCLEASVEPVRASTVTVLTFLSYLAESSSGQGGVKEGCQGSSKHYFLLGGRSEIPTADGRVSKLQGIERRSSLPVHKSAALGMRDLQSFLSFPLKRGTLRRSSWLDLDKQHRSR